jgi:hypothetical protein
MYLNFSNRDITVGKIQKNELILTLNTEKMEKEENNFLKDFFYRIFRNFIVPLYHMPSAPFHV